MYLRLEVNNHSNRPNKKATVKFCIRAEFLWLVGFSTYIPNKTLNCKELLFYIKPSTCKILKPDMMMCIQFWSCMTLQKKKTIITKSDPHVCNRRVFFFLLN